MSWAEYIRDDLKARIAVQDDLPERLSLHGLSSLYAVSTTPVREAVRQLVKEGFIRKNESGRLAVNPRKAGRRTTGNKLMRPERPMDYHETIANDLIMRSMQRSTKPELIREDQTASRYEISRSAVREIFQRLAGSGLLKHIPRRGWQLRPFREEDFNAYLRVREKLELQALDEAWPNLDDVRLQAIHDGNTVPEDVEERPVVDNSLHDYLVEESGNPYIRDFFERHGRYYHVLFNWDGLDRELAIEAVSQHHEIIESLLRRDRRASKKALANHIRYNYGPLIRMRRRENGNPGDDDKPSESPPAKPEASIVNRSKR